MQAREIVSSMIIKVEGKGKGHEEASLFHSCNIFLSHIHETLYTIIHSWLSVTNGNDVLDAQNFLFSRQAVDAGEAAIVMLHVGYRWFENKRRVIATDEVRLALDFHFMLLVKIIVLSRCLPIEHVAQ